MTFNDVSKIKPDDGETVLCHFKVQWNHVFYVATYFEAHGFIPVGGNFAQPDEWCIIEGYSD